MAPQDLKDLGFDESGDSSKTKKSSSAGPPQETDRKESAGFVAGLQKFKDR